MVLEYQFSEGREQKTDKIFSFLKRTKNLDVTKILDVIFTHFYLRT
jgi:hypothetical protein